MYSYYYDFISSKEEYNRRKLCTNGYSKEAREIAGKHKGEFLESELMPRRTKRATELRAATAAAAAAAVPPSGLDALFEVAVSELKSEEKAKRDKALRELAAREGKKPKQFQHANMDAKGNEESFRRPSVPVLHVHGPELYGHSPVMGAMHIPAVDGMHASAMGDIYFPAVGYGVQGPVVHRTLMEVQGPAVHGLQLGDEDDMGEIKPEDRDLSRDLNEADNVSKRFDLSLTTGLSLGRIPWEQTD